MESSSLSGAGLVCCGGHELHRFLETAMSSVADRTPKSNRIDDSIIGPNPHKHDF